MCASRPSYTVQKKLSSPFRIVFFRCFPMCVGFLHRFLRCFCRRSTFCTCQLRLAFVFQLCAGVGGGMGGGEGGAGVMTSMRMRLVSSVSFVAVLLKRCRLLCEALVAASCCFTFETSTMQKPRVFEAFQTKTSQLTLKINKNQRHGAWYLRHFRKNITKKQDQTTMEKKARNIVFFTKTNTKCDVFRLLTTKPPI